MDHLWKVRWNQEVVERASAGFHECGSQGSFFREYQVDFRDNFRKDRWIPGIIKQVLSGIKDPMP